MSFKLSKIVVTKHKVHFYVDQLYVVRMNDNALAQRSHHPNSKFKIASLVIINTNEDKYYQIDKRRELVEIELINYKQ